MKKAIALNIILILLITIFAGCGAGVGEVEPTDNGGFGNARISGGFDIANVNASALTAVREGDVSSLCFTFTVGSRINGTQDEVKSVAVPQYSVYITEAPTRLVVEFPALSYWDYARSFDLSSSPGVLGCFKHSVLSLDTTYIYFQINDFVSFKTREEADKLYVDFIAEDTEDDEKYDYFYTANVYADYCAGTISREIDMTPTLTREDGAVVLISSPFDSENAAKKELKQMLSQNPEINGDMCETIALYRNDPPIYNIELDNALIKSIKAVRVEGLERILPALIPDGIYLAPSSDGFIFSKRESNASWEDSEYDYQELWREEKNSARSKLLRFEFATIEQARYSPDGRKLAILENDTTGSHLYVFDMETMELISDLADAGFGKRISAFTFDALSSSLYAVSGTGSMSINGYDFTVTDETKRFYTVYDGAVDEGNLEYSNGLLYFTETGESGTSIYQIKPEGGIKKKFAEGTSFTISNNGDFMAISTASGVAVEDGNSVLKILNMNTGKESIVSDSFGVYDFDWNSDSTMLLYLENRLSGGDGEDGDSTTQNDAYPYTLYSYSMVAGNSRVICDLMYTAFFVSDDPNTIYIPYYDPETVGEVLRATFVLELS